MIVKMNLNGAPRKQLAKALSLITGEKPIYTKVPECKYLVGDVTILKDGSIECPDDSEVIEELKGYGFAPAEQELVEKPNILEFRRLIGKRILRRKYASSSMFSTT